MNRILPGQRTQYKQRRKVRWKQMPCLWENVHSGWVCLELRRCYRASDLCKPDSMWLSFCKHWTGLQRKCSVYLSVPWSAIYSTQDSQNLPIAPESEMCHSVSFSWLSKNHQVWDLPLAQTMPIGGSSLGKDLTSTELVHKITILILSTPFCMNLEQVWIIPTE